MGKGDQRSKRGKIAAGSFGRLRPRNKAQTATSSAASVVTEKKAALKKAAKKTAK